MKPEPNQDLVTRLARDLTAEKADLVEVLTGLADAGWDTATPAPGWTVRDQIAHLAHFDWVTAMAITAPDRFTALRDSVAGPQHLQAYVDSIGPANASRDGTDMLRWWADQQDRLIDAALSADPTARVPWFGPAMSLASKLSARLMETWAHGQDVVDALGAQRLPSERLIHVAGIGVRALPYSFMVHGREVPSAEVRVELVAPSGERWTWGPEDAKDSVTGNAMDFCLLVTQRRHRADTALEITGETAHAWADVAQAFAGPAGSGRQPGQFGTNDATAVHP